MAVTPNLTKKKTREESDAGVTCAGLGKRHLHFWQHWRDKKMAAMLKSPQK